jgi:hypothetical protein
MVSIRKHRRRELRWSRYIKKTSRSSRCDTDYPFGLSIKITPGFYGPRCGMRWRGREWYAVQRIAEEMFQ